MQRLRRNWIGLLMCGAPLIAAGCVKAADAAPSVPLTAEQLAERASVENGRLQALNHGCGDCHGGWVNPASPQWMGGMTDSVTQSFQIGPFKTYPRNLTPDNQTGIGRFTERQIFNALRYGLRPGETPDVTITGMTPGEGNYPENPKYLAPPMPWPAFRHMSDQDLWDIAAYLKRAVKPIVNKVPDSEGPPDFWASTYTVEAMGPYPAPAFPTAQEQRPE